MGRHLCLLGKKEFEVCYTYLNNPIDIEGCKAFKLDITDRERVINLVNSVSPGIIYHTAYDRTNLWTSIVDGTTNLVDAFKRLQERFRKGRGFLLSGIHRIRSDQGEGQR